MHDSISPCGNLSKPSHPLNQVYKNYSPRQLQLAAACEGRSHLLGMISVLKSADGMTLGHMSEPFIDAQISIRCSQTKSCERISLSRSRIASEV